MTKKYKICIDAGHGGIDAGAVNGNYYEKEAALMIACKLGRVLALSGVEVIYTRKNDSTVELEERTAFANKNAADYFISIHLNAAANKQANGIETFAYSEGSTAHKLATAVQKELISKTGAADRKVKTANFYVLRKTAMPAILVETGFISNDAEAKALFTDGYQTIVANAIAEAVLNFLGIKEDTLAVKRYNYLLEIPAGEFRETVKELMEKKIIRQADGKLNLSHDMVRELVFNRRAGHYK